MGLARTSDEGAGAGERDVLLHRRMTRPLVIAVDGPAASGKGTIAARLAAHYRLPHLDTGLLYRAVTWLAEARGVPVDDPASLVALVSEVELAPDATGRLARVMVDGVDHTDDVRGPAVWVRGAQQPDGAPGLVAEITVDAASELQLVPGDRVWFSVKAHEVSLHPAAR